MKSKSIYKNGKLLTNDLSLISLISFGNQKKKKSCQMRTIKISDFKYSTVDNDLGSRVQLQEPMTF